MANRKRAFERIPSCEPIYSELDIPDLPQVRSGRAASENRGRAFRRCYSPTTVEELLELEGFYHLLGKSFVFFHNRQESSDLLIETIMKIGEGTFDFRFFQTHSSSLEDILKEMEKQTSLTEKPQIPVIDTTGIINVNDLCTSIALENRRSGIWLRGYICDLNPKTISLFDALFAFDMSVGEYEILRSTIALSSDVIKQLRESTNYLDSRENVLFFRNYKRFDDAPLLTRNPIVLT